MAGASAIGAGLLAVSACGGGGDDAGPTVVATTSLLGDLVEQVAGDQVDVEVLIPAGVDQHNHSLSAREVARVREADAIVINGGELEAVVGVQVGWASDDGVATFVALDAVDAPLTVAPDAVDHDHGDDDDEHGDGDDDHDHGEVDPHFFGDPLRTAEVVEALGSFLADTVDGIDRPALEASVAAYLDELRRLDAEVEDILGAVPPSRRVLATNHRVLDYFADRYDFEIPATVQPGTSSFDNSSASQIVNFTRFLEERGINVVFTDVSASTRRADLVVQYLNLPDARTVPLHTEALGEEGSGAETYVDMVRSNARAIADALASES